MSGAKPPGSLMSRIAAQVEIARLRQELREADASSAINIHRLRLLAPDEHPQIGDFIEEENGNLARLRRLTLGAAGVRSYYRIVWEPETEQQT